MASDGSTSCDESGCGTAADFRFYDPSDPGWRPLCERHALEIHPSLEIGALLESGYLKPVEIAVPTGPPDAPRNGRSRAFRSIVEDLLDR